MSGEGGGVCLNEMQTIRVIVGWLALQCVGQCKRQRGEKKKWTTQVLVYFILAL